MHFSAIEPIGDPKYGILTYKDGIQNGKNLIQRIENLIGDKTERPFCWSEAMVGDNEKMPEYRDCVDFKIGERHLDVVPQELNDLAEVYKETSSAIKGCLAHYQSIYNINMEYMEAINYVRYGPGQHFAIHCDDGFSYNCTVSSIAYLNDDYSGGELWFPFFDLAIKPSAGDVILFPSTFIYAHAAMPVHDGTKYSAVTMFDWNDRTHQ